MFQAAHDVFFRIRIATPAIDLCPARNAGFDLVTDGIAIDNSGRMFATLSDRLAEIHLDELDELNEYLEPALA